MRPIVLHAHQNPAAVQPLALQRELEFAVRERLLGVRAALRLPIAAVPQLNRSAAILALRDRALEVAIVERMVLDLDREALIVRIERGTPRHRPGLEHAVEFETEVVVKARRVVLLNDKTPPLPGADRRRAGRLRGFREIPLRLVCRETLAGCHGAPSIKKTAEPPVTPRRRFGSPRPAPRRRPLTGLLAKTTLPPLSVKLFCRPRVGVGSVDLPIGVASWRLAPTGGAI